jgi:hypothetical protein
MDRWIDRQISEWKDGQIEYNGIDRQKKRQFGIQACR